MTLTLTPLLVVPLFPSYLSEKELSNHFNSPHHIMSSLGNHWYWHFIQIDSNCRLDKEKYWIQQLRVFTPFGIQQLECFHTIWFEFEYWWIDNRLIHKAEKMQNFSGIWSQIVLKMWIFYKFSEIFERKRQIYRSKWYISSQNCKDFPPKASQEWDY